MFAELDVEPEHVCYIGDDLPDLPVMRTVGLGVAVADATEEVRQAAHHITTLRGGQGAVRETIERILKQKGSWDGLVGTYTGS